MIEFAVGLAVVLAVLARLNQDLVYRLLLGADDSLVYDPVEHRLVMRYQRSRWWRLKERMSAPFWRIRFWMFEWDYRFQWRYRDRRARCEANIPPESQAEYLIGYYGLSLTEVMRLSPRAPWVK